LIHYIDTHCHLDDSCYDDDRETVIQRAIRQGVTRMLCVSQDLNSARKILSWIDSYPEIFMSVGWHPHLAKEYSSEMKEALIKLSKLPKVISIGEVGLDYHYDFSPREIQKIVLREMYEIALETNLPIIIHSRESDGDIISILNEYKDKVRGVIHCFSGNPQLLDAALNAGYYLSISGTITFKNSIMLRDVVQKIPLDKILAETDSPYLSPIPFRGKRNEPEHVIEVTDFLADLMKTPRNVFAEKIKANATDLWGIP